MKHIAAVLIHSLVTSWLVQLLSTWLSVREVWGSIRGPVKSAQCRQELATDSMFLWRRKEIVVQAQRNGDGPHH